MTLNEIPPHAVQPLDIKHRNASAEVRRQAQVIARRSGGEASPVRLRLNIIVTDNISVTGRGLNVLLGGRLAVSGTPSALVTNGAFNLRRGSLKLLSRRIEFERGRLDFRGDLDPRINFVAVSRSTDATIRLIISGRASQPNIEVTSSPELPQEEALARLVFDRNLVQLAPLQIAQLASSIAVLSGSGGNNSLLGGLQSALGVDWLEITETASGETAVGLGKQISDKLSIGVEQTTKTNTSRVTIDLNLKRNFKLRGSAGSDGSTGAGIFFQKDY